MTPVQIIIVLFLLLTLTLVLGLWRFRSIDSFEKYAFGDEKMNTGILAISFIATFVGAGDLIAPNYVYQYGVVDQLEVIGYSFVFLLFIFFLSKKLAKKQGLLTMSDLMTDSYGKSIGLLSSVIGIASSVVIGGLQLNYLRGIGKDLLGVDAGSYFTLGIGLLLTIYMATGGMRAVALTDLLQLSLVVIVVVYLAQEGVARVKALSDDAVEGSGRGLSSFYEAVKQKYPDKLSFSENPEFAKCFRASLFWGFFPAFLLAPPLLQRMLMSRVPRVRSVFWSGLFFYPFLRFFLTLIGLSALVLIPHLKEKESLRLTSFSVNLFGRESWMTGLTMVGTIALALSTADSFLHSAVVLAMQDIVKPWLLPKKASKKATLRATRLVACSLVWLALLVEGDVSQMLFYAISLLSLITIPLIAAILERGGSPSAVWCSIGASGIGFVLFRYFGSSYFSEKDLRYYAWFFAILVNGVIFVLINWWSPVKRKTSTRKEVLWEEEKQVWYKTLLSWVADLKAPIIAAKRKVKKHGSFPFTFTWFLFILYMVPTWDQNHAVIGVVRIFSVIFCIGLLGKSTWSPKMQEHYFPMYYLLTITYCLPFASTVLFFTQPTNGMAQMVIFLSFLLLVVLVDWQSFCFSTIFGISAGAIFLYLYEGHFFPVITTEIAWSTLVGLVFTIFIGMLFVRKERWVKEAQHQVLLEKAATKTSELQMVQAIQKQLVTLLHAQKSFLGEAYLDLNALRHKCDDKELVERIVNTLQHLERTKARYGSDMPLHLEKIAFKTLFSKASERIKQHRVRYMPHLTNKLSRSYCVGDQDCLVAIVVNALKYMQEKDPGGISYVYWADTVIDYGNQHRVLGYRMLVSNERVERWPAIESMGKFVEGDSGNSLLLAQNKQMLYAHFGRMDLIQRGALCLQSYVLPYNLDKVRTQVEHFADAYYLPDRVLNGKEDIAFLLLVKERALPFTVIKKALLDSKQYHYKQKREGHEAYYLHFLRIATALLPYTEDGDLIAATLLQGVVEGSSNAFAQVEMRYGRRVTSFLQAIGQVGTSFLNKGTEAFVDDKQRGVVLIKLFGYLDDMRSLPQEGAGEKRRAFAEKALTLFLPLAKQLSLPAVVQELEELIGRYPDLIIDK